MIYKDKDVIRNEIVQDFTSLGISGISPLSPGAIIAENYSEHVGSLYGKISEIESEYNPSNYAGERLIREAGKFGVEQEKVVPLEDNTFSNFYFKLSGTTVAGDITVDKTQGFTIPAGTVLSTTDGDTFYTRDPAIFEPEDNKIYVRIYSLGTAVGNISPNTITTHTANLKTILNIDSELINEVQLECNNTTAIISESVVRTEEELKAIIQLEYQGLNQINEPKARSAILRVPGVSNVKFIENFNGVGSVGAVITPVNPLASEGLYVSVEDSLRANMLGGEYIAVIRPEYLSVGILATAETTEDVEDTSTLYNEIKFFVATSVNQVQQGETLSPVNIEQLVLEAYRDQLTSFKIVCMTINDNRCLVQPQVSAEDQKFIVYDAAMDVKINA